MSLLIPRPGGDLVGQPGPGGGWILGARALLYDALGQGIHNPPIMGAILAGIGGGGKGKMARVIDTSQRTMAMAGLVRITKGYAR